jgi:deoxyadenosine/deoxycytidine kinase
MHIAIVGNIGAGKTTLAHKLAQHFRWEVFLEEVDDNPYLKDFYADMPRWAFHLQVYFLNGRFRQTRRIKELVSEGKSVIQDRTIYEDAHIFAANLHQSGLLAERDYNNYYALFESMINLVDPPDLLLYLRADLRSAAATTRTPSASSTSRISTSTMTSGLPTTSRVSSSLST